MKDHDDNWQWILEKIQNVFAPAPRPHHFRNRQHCEECARWDDIFSSWSQEDLDISDVDEPPYTDAIGSINAEGFIYFIPAFCRIALSHPDSFYGSFLDTLKLQWPMLEAHQKAVLEEFIEFALKMRLTDSVQTMILAKSILETVKGDEERPELHDSREEIFNLLKSLRQR